MSGALAVSGQANSSGTKGLVLNLDFSNAANTAISGAFSSIVDLSSSGNTATQLTAIYRPSVLSADQFGLDTASFSAASSQVLNLASTIDLSAGYTMFSVCKLPATGLNATLGSDNVNDCPLYWHSNNHIYSNYKGATYMTAHGYSSAGYQVIGTQRNADGTFSIFSDEVSTDLTYGGPYSNPNIDIYKYVGKGMGSYSTGAVGQIKVFSHAMRGGVPLTAGEIKKENTILEKQWGLYYPVFSTLGSPFTSGTYYESWPGFTLLPNKTQICLARRASDHLASDGKLIQWTSTDQGATWGQLIIYDPTAGGWGVMDAEVDMLQDGQTIVAHWGEWNPTANPTLQTRVMFGAVSGSSISWDAPVTVTGNSCEDSGNKILEIPSGDLLLFTWWYSDNNINGTTTNARLRRGTKTGVRQYSWGDYITIADGVSLSRAYSESSAVITSSGRIYCMIRCDQGGYYSVHSDDLGHTWTAPKLEFSGLSLGRPFIVCTGGDGILFYGRNFNIFSPNAGGKWEAALSYKGSGYNNGQPYNQQATSFVLDGSVLRGVVSYDLPNAICNIFSQTITL
jgi:hypothetical protein